MQYLNRSKIDEAARNFNDSSSTRVELKEIKSSQSPEDQKEAKSNTSGNSIERIASRHQEDTDSLSFGVTTQTHSGEDSAYTKDLHRIYRYSDFNSVTSRAVVKTTTSSNKINNDNNDDEEDLEIELVSKPNYKSADDKKRIIDLFDLTLINLLKFFDKTGKAKQGFQESESIY